MPPTNAAPSLMLSFRRADTAAFAILGTAIFWAAGWLAAARLEVEQPWAWGAAAGVSVLLPGLLWTPWFEIGIRAWNKLMRGSIIALRAYVLKVCYYVLFAAVGRGGSSLDLFRRPAEGSRWVPCDESGWRGGNGWVRCLLPVVLLLKVLRNEHQQDAPASSATYTLY